MNLDKTVERAEHLALSLNRMIQTAWLRFRFATGQWNGVMLHASPQGNLGKSFLVQGLRINESSPEYKITRNGEEVLTIGTQKSE